MYTQRLEILLHAFRVSGQSGLVSLEPLQSLPEPWIAHLKLVKGEVGSCQVRRKKDGQVLLSDGEALQWLENEEELSWRLQEASQPILSPRFTAYTDGLHQQSIVREPLNSAQELGQIMSSRGSSPVYREPTMPRRTDRNMPSTASWPRDYRQVFALVDSHRTREDIALLLHLSPQRVTSILCELQARGLVEL